MIQWSRLSSPNLLQSVQHMRGVSCPNLMLTSTSILADRWVWPCYSGLELSGANRSAVASRYTRQIAGSLLHRHACDTSLATFISREGKKGSTIPGQSNRSQRRRRGKTCPWCWMHEPHICWGSSHPAAPSWLSESDTTGKGVVVFM